MATFTEYWVLKDPNSLPPNVSFLDPYDNAEYLVHKTDTLETLTQKVVKHQKDNKYPEIFPADLQPFITQSLAIATDPAIRPKYFDKRAVPPTARELVTMVTTLAAQIRNNKQVSYLTRQERAKTCHANECRQHSNKSFIHKVANFLTEKVLSIRSISNSENEIALGRCNMCGCGLQGKNKLNVTNILAGLHPNELAKMTQLHRDTAFDKCWILKEALQHEANRNLLFKKLKTASPDQSEHLLIYEQQKVLKNDR